MNIRLGIKFAANPVGGYGVVSELRPQKRIISQASTARLLLGGWLDESL